MNFKEETTITTNDTNTSTGVVAPAITAEYIAKQLVSTVTYLKETGAPMGKKFSMVKIWGQVTNLTLPKALGSEIRQELEEQGLVAGKNGNIPIFKDLGNYQSLVYYANFNGAIYTVPKLDTSNMSAYELSLYEDARAKFEALPKEDLLDKRLNELGLALPVFNQDTITITGKAIKDIDSKLLDIPEVTQYLPAGVELIVYNNSPYFYVTTRCQMEMVLKALSNMELDMPLLFYKTFSGEIWTDNELKAGRKSYPPCEDLPEGAEFESFPEQEFALAIHTSEAYITLIERGIYQRYYNKSEWNKYQFHINHYFLPSPINNATKEDVIDNLVNTVFPALDAVKKSTTLEFIKDDLIANVAHAVDDFIIETIDKKISLLS